MAVATHVPGFDTLGGLVPAFAFHAITSIIGFQLLKLASRGSVLAAPAAAVEAVD